MSAERGNALTGAEAVVFLLRQYGVEIVFGLCGDTSLPLYDALARLDHGIVHVLARDERSAAYMADAYARLSGRVGVCEGPSGGGATYILPGVVEANESSVPLLAITSDISVSARGRFTLTEIDQEALFRPATKWNAVIDRAADIPRTMRAAFSAITAGRPARPISGCPTTSSAIRWRRGMSGPARMRRAGRRPTRTRSAPRPTRSRALRRRFSSAAAGC